MIQVILATKNSGKIREIENLLKDSKFRILTFKDFKSWPEIEERGSSFAENALIKARDLVRFHGLPVLADDSGLEIEYLDGRPGVLSSRYAGYGATDEENIQKVLREMQGCPEDRKGARFRCVVVFLTPAVRCHVAQGICPGRITFNRRGKGGFGYDPIFIPDGFTRTMAELTLAEKNEISHRAKALRSLLKIVDLKNCSDHSKISGRIPYRASREQEEEQ
ncbi:MAG: Non-canonical purine NTP pyrophosphatase [Actinobacteria bacterium]|nr:Non-canonical purine NTP pyrophosphatase [Actinomycetota bacterium]